MLTLLPEGTRLRLCTDPVPASSCTETGGCAWPEEYAVMRTL